MAQDFKNTNQNKYGINESQHDYNQITIQNNSFEKGLRQTHPSIEYQDQREPFINNKKGVKEESLQNLNETKNEEYSSSQKKGILLSCLIALFIGNMMIYNVTVFLPLYTDGKHDWDGVVLHRKSFNETANEFYYEEYSVITSTQVSIIIAVFSIASIIFAPFNSCIKNKIGSKNSIVLGYIMMGFTTFGLGLLTLIDNSTFFIYTAIALRFFQGQGDVLLQITCYSIITTVFKDDLIKYISYIEITAGLGLSLGPALGQLVYGTLQFGFQKTMFFFAILNTIGMLLCIFLMPSQLNKTIKEEQMMELLAEMQDVYETDRGNQQIKKKNITLFKVLSNKHSFFALFMCLIGTFDVTFYEGFISINLRTKGVDENKIGYVFVVNSAAYLGCCVIFEHFFGQISRKILFVICPIFAGLSMFLFGPSLLLSFPDNCWLTISSFFTLGIVQAFFFIPLIPEMMERMQVDFNIKEGENEELENQLNDKINDAYGLIYAIACFISPILGSKLKEYLSNYSVISSMGNTIELTDPNLGQRRFSDYIAFFNFGIAIIFFVFNCGFLFYQEDKQFKQKLKNLKKIDEIEQENQEKQKGRRISTALQRTQNAIMRGGSLNYIDQQRLRMEQQYRIKKEDYKHLLENVRGGSFQIRDSTFSRQHSNSFFVKTQSIKSNRSKSFHSVAYE